MTKLYGTADATLVSAAFRHGVSNIPHDMSNIYKQREANFATFATGIKNVFDKVYADDRKTWDLLADNAQKSLDLLESGGEVNDYYLDMHQDVVEGFKTRLKATPDGKKGERDRSKLRAEMNKYLSTIQSNETLELEMTKNAANSSLMSTLGDDKKKLFNMV